MKIKKVRAEKFRTLADFSLDLAPNYCAISGKNNAGKSAVVRIIRYFFQPYDDEFGPFRDIVTPASDITQWATADQLSMGVCVEFDRVNDSEMFFVLEKFSPKKKIDGGTATASLDRTMNKDGSSSLKCIVNGELFDAQSSSEVIKKFRSAQNLFVHNSTQSKSNYYYAGAGSYTEVLETNFSAEDRRKIAEAEKGLQTRVRRAATRHKEELDNLLGKLADKYSVELSAVRSRSSSFPLELKLNDKSVGVPLSAWGAGTQNRTRVLMAMLEAVRIRDSTTAENRSTPVFLVEEPESFLHPSAQAEFGQVLNGLADELNIQIIATTHSPYMLNQSEPSANYLLERKLFRGKPMETTIRDTSGDDWMLPFAENLGVVPKEFDSWKKVFGAHGRVVLVEGAIDKKYFDLVKTHYPSLYTIPDDVEILPYDGKDALKNTSILQFMINKFSRVFITFDLDAKDEVKPALERIGLREGDHFCAVGLPGAGEGCIEGLLPATIKSTVYAENVAHVTALGSADSKARRQARDALKKAFLVEFERVKPPVSELGELKKLISSIASRF